MCSIYSFEKTQVQLITMQEHNTAVNYLETDQIPLGLSSIEQAHKDQIISCSEHH